jgi:hypothetical protein
VKATRAILTEVFKEEPLGGWHVEYPDTPKQQDKGDSGIFAMQVALAVTEYGRPEVEFGQHLMVELRRLCAPATPRDVFLLPPVDPASCGHQFLGDSHVASCAQSQRLPPPQS